MPVDEKTKAIIDEIESIIKGDVFYTPTTPRGAAFCVYYTVIKPLMMGRLWEIKRLVVELFDELYPKEPFEFKSSDYERRTKNYWRIKSLCEFDDPKDEPAPEPSKHLCPIFDMKDYWKMLCDANREIYKLKNERAEIRTKSKITPTLTGIEKKRICDILQALITFNINVHKAQCMLNELVLEIKENQTK
jgi:hypothetical protein